MNLVKAVRAFLSVCLGGGSCEHPRVNILQAPAYCTDCGYQVKIEWAFVQCRRCHVKRVPQKTFWGKIKPVEQFCRRCGYEGFKITQKARIEAFELMYALCVKSTAYEEEWNPKPSVSNPFKPTTRVVFEGGDILEAEIIRKTEFRGTRSAFKASPYQWQQRQEPYRYGGTYSTTKPTGMGSSETPNQKCSIVSLRKSSS